MGPYEALTGKVLWEADTKSVYRKDWDDLHQDTRDWAELVAANLRTVLQSKYDELLVYEAPEAKQRPSRAAMDKLEVRISNLYNKNGHLQARIQRLEQLIMDYRSHSDVLLACLEQDSEAITAYDDELDRRGAELELWPGKQEQQ